MSSSDSNSGEVKVKTEVLLPNSTPQEIQPSPLALLAATCSKIGGVNQNHQNEHNDGQQSQNNAVAAAAAQALQTGQIRVVSAAVLQQLQEQQNRAQAQGQNQPQVITLSQLQNFLPTLLEMHRNYQLLYQYKVCPVKYFKHRIITIKIQDLMLFSQCKRLTLMVRRQFLFQLPLLIWVGSLSQEVKS